MFGMFFSGDLYFGKSPRGKEAPIRTNPDIDGSLIPTATPVGEFGLTGYDSGAFTRTQPIQSVFSTGDIIEEGSFTNTYTPQGKIDRIK